MGDILKAISSSYGASNDPAWAEAVKYLQSGDEAVLARIKPGGARFTYWLHDMVRAMSPPEAVGEMDRRALRILAAYDEYWFIAEWAGKGQGREAPDEDSYRVVRKELAASGVSESRLAGATIVYVMPQKAGRPTSAGRYLLSLSDQALKAALVGAMAMMRVSSSPHLVTFVNLLLNHAPDRLPPLIDTILRGESSMPQVCGLLLEKDPGRYEEIVAAYCRSLPMASKFTVASQLHQVAPARYAQETLVIARACLNSSWCRGLEEGKWMIRNFGAEILGDLEAFIAKGDSYQATWIRNGLITEAIKVLEARSVPLLVAAIRTGNFELGFSALGHLITFAAESHADLIRSEIARGLEDPAPEHLVRFLMVVARTGVADHEERAWSLLAHKSKPVRSAAARALGTLGDRAVPRGAGLLKEKKADLRGAAVALLSAIGTARALEALEARVDLESSDDVRDAILLTLDAVRASEGREVTREEIEARVARAATKLEVPVTDWINDESLPPLTAKDGSPLGPQVARYLLHRQSRAKAIEADVEARPLYALIDRKTSGDFALDVLKRYAATQAAPDGRWALAVAGLLGDDRALPVLRRLVDDWASSSRGKMAEYAVQALALLGTDAALMTLDSIATRFRTKNRNIGQAAVDAFEAAAERAGVTPDELGDRVVPWFGFEPGQPRVIDCGGRRIEAAIGPDFKLKFTDLDKKKAVASLPKTAPKEVLDEFKALPALLRESVKAQTLRLENLMVRQYRWPLERWSELFLAHPLLLPFASRLVWGAYDEASGQLLGTFRTLDDRTLTDSADDEFVLPQSCTLGMVHPLELSDDRRQAWLTHLADYEVIPPFPQLERPVVRVADDRSSVKFSHDLEGTELNAMTFKGRAEKLGWTRGSVTDGGGIEAYRKTFPAAGAEAFLQLEGMYMGIGMDSSITLGKVSFVKPGSVQVGSYVYDTPNDENDPRLIPFGDVPPVVFSEVMGDLQKISGKGDRDEAE